MVFGWFNTSVEPADDKANEMAQWARDMVSDRDSGDREWSVDILGTEYEVLVTVESRSSLIPFSGALGWDHDVRTEIRSDGVLLSERHYDRSVDGDQVRSWLMGVHSKLSVQDVRLKD